MNNIIKVTKEQRVVAEEFVTKFSLGRNNTVEVTNDIEHKIAECFVADGLAIVTKKKNYGRIAEIKRI